MISMDSSSGAQPRAERQTGLRDRSEDFKNLLRNRRIQAKKGKAAQSQLRVIAAVFFILRNRKPRKTIFKMTGKIKLLLKVVPCIVSLAIGSTWLSITMLFEETAFHVTLAMFMFYTILGFVMYLVSEAVFSLIRRLLPH